MRTGVRDLTSSYSDLESANEDNDGKHRKSRGHSDDTSSDDNDNFLGKKDKEKVTLPNEALESDMYGMTVCSLVRDMYFLGSAKGVGPTRYARVSTTLFLLFGCMVIQVYLLSQVKHFVSAKAVHDIREAYDAFEKEMYWEWTMSPNGKHRGKGPMKDPGVFYNMTDSEQADVCRIPLSQPVFFFTVLFIWSLTCMQEIRKSWGLFYSLIWDMDRIDSMSGALEPDEDDDSNDNIVGITGILKAVILGIVILPRLGITCYLVWLGCRWLLATNNFADLILNAVALEFILVLKDLIYNSLVPVRNKHDLERTLIRTKHTAKTELMPLVSTLGWALLAAVWVLSYMGIKNYWMGFQQVLPGYRWDVHAVCEPWVTWRYCVSAVCPASALDAYHQYAGRSLMAEM
eukprot:TRINITY_DN22371_c0_g1_i1.p1 TRINITY_DN22371_c0_g1~~TRINITY_DN22371_c0_g1_i1.p1  ORF type:complete len:402 (+),score=44.99 TRINITY_DN22371_c0_g1_i1:103-1308(+)